jgi:hypothetical protein
MAVIPQPASIAIAKTTAFLPKRLRMICLKTLTLPRSGQKCYNAKKPIRDPPQPSRLLENGGFVGFLGVCLTVTIEGNRPPARVGASVIRHAQGEESANRPWGGRDAALRKPATVLGKPKTSAMRCGHRLPRRPRSGSAPHAQ